MSRGTTYRKAADAPEDLRSKAATTRRDLIAFATERYQLLGFRAVSIDAIVRGCGLSKPSLYHYFRSKEALIVACLQSDETRLAAGADHAVALAGPTPADRLRALVRYYAAEVSPIRGRGTLMANAALEFTDESNPVRLAAVASSRHLRDRLFVLVDPMVGPSAQDVTDHLLLLIQGLGVNGLCLGAERSGDALMRSVDAVIAPHLAATATRSAMNTP